MADPWRMCTAATTLRAETNTRWPRRDKASDGGIGDAAHASRSSDHNPWIKKPPPPNMGVVRATDTDVDGIDAAWFAEHVRLLGAAGDPRLTGGGYVIFNRRITTQDWKGWKVYSGSNPHTAHVHVSFTRDPAGFDLDRPWGIAAAATPTPTADPEAPEMNTQERAAFDYMRRQMDTMLAQLTGSPDPAKFPGWDVNRVTTGTSATVVDMLRRLIQANHNQQLALEAVARLAGQGGGASAADINKAVAEALRDNTVRVDIQGVLS